LEPVLCARFLEKIQSQHFSKNTLRKGKKHNVTVVFMVPKTFTKLSVQNKAELILYGRLKKEQFLGIQQKDITKLAEVDFWPTNTS
jgi:cytochrome c oxidase assembly protein Cox11